MTLLSIQSPSACSEAHEVAACTQHIWGLHIVLLKSSKYDDDGSVLRHTVEVLDEAVHKINVPKIIHCSRRKGWKTLVCLVSVQTNQYPRAVDLALALRTAGLDVLSGGFHVSDVLALFHHLTPDIQGILDLGMTVVAGEVEAEWERVLQEEISDEIKPLYNFLEATLDLSPPPVPMPHQKYLQRYESRFATMPPV
jgi:hypothetical protein